MADKDKKNVHKKTFDDKSELSMDDNEIREIIVERKTGFNMAEVIVIIILSILFGGIIGGVITYSYNNKDHNISDSKISSDLDEFVFTYNNILDNYYESVDKKELLNAAIEGMINSLGDDYSSYMNSSETETFNQTVDGEYTGIGATVSNVNGKNQIVALFQKSPAVKAGLKVGDVFSKIDGKDVSSFDIDKLTNMIKGGKGTTVNISVIRGDDTVTVKVVRNNIEIPSVSSKVFDFNSHKVGYITVSTFASNTYSQFNKELNNLEKKNIDSLIVDLRDNPGGHLNQVTSILSLFLPKNKILYQLETKGVKQPVYSLNNKKRTYKVAVLINSNSASASEIMAAGFKESYPDSIIVGVNSYGKGTVQQAYELSSGSSLKFTVQKWLTPNGNWINEVGVTPDEVVELDSSYWDNPTYDSDNQLQKALQLVTTKN